ncbi:MAG TPA: hypothetical protein VLA13_05805, partial [Massilibacterium sp.]|nr:hypothetical protein [Massilibacterium sp.]
EDGQHIADKLRILAPMDNVAWVFTSGNNSAHVLINGSLFGNPIVSQNRTGVFHRLALKLAGDVRHKNNVDNPYTLDDDILKEELFKVYPDARHQKFDPQKACAALENLDPNIYRVNSLIRQPWSLHESTGNAKGLLGDATPTKLNLTSHKPILLDMYFDSWERPEPKKKKTFDKVYNSNYIVEEYSKYYPDIVHMEPNHNGWVGRFHSIWYDDRNPDVTININTGALVDFGSQRYSMSFEEFLLRTRQL